jgi:hypothetical protein
MHFLCRYRYVTEKDAIALSEKVREEKVANLHKVIEVIGLSNKGLTNFNVPIPRSILANTIQNIEAKSNMIQRGSSIFQMG